MLTNEFFSAVTSSCGFWILAVFTHVPNGHRQNLTSSNSVLITRFRYFQIPFSRRHRWHTRSSSNCDPVSSRCLVKQGFVIHILVRGTTFLSRGTNNLIFFFFYRSLRPFRLRLSRCSFKFPHQSFVFSSLIIRLVISYLFFFAFENGVFRATFLVLHSPLPHYRAFPLCWECLAHFILWLLIVSDTILSLE